MLHIALFEPEIPPNTGNIARSCAATGTRLHLIGRLGFRIDEPSLKRAGVDCWEHADVQRHADWAAFRAAIGASRIIPFSSHATTPWTQVAYRPDDCLLFGSESRGLPTWVESAEGDTHPPVVLPIASCHVRSLNLATAAAIVLYEALRQLGKV